MEGGVVRVLSEKPLVFIDCDSADEISVHFRSINHKVKAAFEKVDHPCVSLNDLIEEDSAITYGIVQAGDHFENGIPMLKVTNFLEGRQLNDGPFERVNPALAAKYKRSRLVENDILLSIRGSVGKIAYVPKRLEGANLNQDIAVIRLADKKDNDFVALFLESDLAKLQMTLHTRGAAVKGINLKELREVKIPILSKDEKACIKKRFDEIITFSNRVFEKSKKVFEKRNELFKLILDSISTEIGLSKFPSPWFGRLYFQKVGAGIDRLDVLGANPQFEDECWASGKFVPLSDVCDVNGSNEQIPIGIQRYISIDSLPGNYWGDIDAPEMEIEKQTGRTHFYPGDIAWAHLKPSILQGKAYIINDECWGSHHFLKLVASKVSEDLRTIIWAYLKTGPIKRHLANKCTGKSESQKDVSDKALGMLPFPNLNENQIKKVASAIRKTVEKSHDLEDQENEYKEKANRLLKEAKSNIFNLLDDEWFNNLVTEAKEALQ